LKIEERRVKGKRRKDWRLIVEPGICQRQFPKDKFPETRINNQSPFLLFYLLLGIGTYLSINLQIDFNLSFTNKIWKIIDRTQRERE